MTKTSKKLALLTTLLAASTALTACTQYTTREEGISSHAGDAIAFNASNQTVDPWPDGFQDTDIPTDGTRQADAIKNYKTVHQEKPKSEAQPVQLVVPTN